jgi:hypothetical protein
MAVIGYSWPDNPAIPNGAFAGVLSWDDFGLAMMGSVAGGTIGLPAWIPSTPPGAATSDHLVTTIVSGAGTTSLTLSTAAGTSVSGAGIRMDAVPGIKAAMVAATAVAANNNGTFPIYFPLVSTANNSYVINSFLDLTPYPNPTLMVPSGLFLNHTIQLPIFSKITGGKTIPSTGSGLAFGYESLPVISVFTAYPGIYFTNGIGNLLQDLTITGNVQFNQNLLIVQDTGGANPGTTYSNVELNTGSGNDIVGINILARGVNSGPNVAPAQLILDRVTADSGPNSTQGISATPGILCAQCAGVTIKSLTMSHRGFYMGVDASGGGVTSSYFYIQGGIMPAFSFSAAISSNASPSVSYAFFYGPTSLDTDPDPLLTNFNTTTGGLTPYIYDNPSSNGSFPTYSGNPMIVNGRSAFRQSAGQNRDMLNFSANQTVDGTFTATQAKTQALLYSAAHVGVGPTYSLFMDAPAMQTLATAVVAGGSVPVGAHTYQIAPVWQNGGVGEFSPAVSATTTTGNQTVNLTWTPTLYCKGYYVARDGNGLGNNVVPLVVGCASSSFSDNGTFPNSGLPLEPAGGPTVLMPNAQGVVTPALQLASGPGGASQLYLDNTTLRTTVNENNTGATPLSKSICVNVTPVTVNANVATDQNLMTCTLPAGILNLAGRTLRITTGDLYTTPVASVATINTKVKLCTVSGCGSGTVITLANITSSANPGTVTNNSINLQLLSTTQTGGASSAYEAHGNMVVDLGASPGLADSTFSDSNTATIGTIDSTAQLFLQITGAFSVASASNSRTERQLIVEVLN